MPYYDFLCEDCKKITTIKLSVKELENTINITCKNCNSQNTKRYFQPVAINQSKKEREFVGCGENCRCIN